MPESHPDNEVYWKQRLGTNYDDPVSAIVAKPIEQYPSLTRNAPTGIDDSTTVAAWNAAERADADPPIKGMAYRQVLESALKALEGKLGAPSKSGTPLAKRVELLIAKDGLPNHLPELIEKARGLGNRAAHEFDDFDRRDVAIIRDLCEAVLRQCFTIPALVERTEQLIEKRKVEAAKKKATKSSGGITPP